jgi:hypothetical protein
MALTRQYNPELWKTLEGLGIGKLAVHGTREREMVNIYRGSDAARELDDAPLCHRAGLHAAGLRVGPAADGADGCGPARGCRRSQQDTFGTAAARRRRPDGGPGWPRLTPEGVNA